MHQHTCTHCVCGRHGALLCVYGCVGVCVGGWVGVCVCVCVCFAVVSTQVRGSGTICELSSATLRWSKGGFPTNFITTDMIDDNIYASLA